MKRLDFNAKIFIFYDVEIFEFNGENSQISGYPNLRRLDTKY